MNVTNNDYSTNKLKKYYPPPPFIDSVIQYPNVSKDPRLRELMTTFFLKKCIKWIKTDKEFEKYKEILPTLEKNGYNIIYNLLRHAVKKYNFEWFDLKYYDKYSAIKHFFKKNLNIKSN